MTNVNVLSLASNPIKKVSQNTFNGKIPYVMELYLDHCELQEFDVEHYVLIYLLSTLDLSYNLIEEVPNQTLSSDHVYWTFRTENVTFTGNKFKSLSITPMYSDIDRMKVDRNQIEFLTDEDFKIIFVSESLELQENKIQWIDTDTFEPLKDYLEVLDLSSNLIQSVNGSIRYLSKLKRLNLTYNLIQFFADDEFKGLNELSELYLQHNQIKVLAQLQQLSQLKYLDITQNDMNYINPNHIPKTFRLMYVAGNPLRCNCDFQPFVIQLNKFPSLDIIDFCLKSDVLITTKCPQTCSCGCSNYENISFMAVDCSSKKLSTLPQFLKRKFLQMEDNESIMIDNQSPLVFYQNKYDSFHIKDRVLEVNLENNSLESIETVQLPPNLIQLFLANNLLRWLPESIFENMRDLKQVSLSGNPWACNCNALNFKKWLTTNYAIFQDFDNIRCGKSDKGESNLKGRLVWKLSDQDICPSVKGLTLPVSLSVLIFLTFSLAAKFLHVKYKFNINAFLYANGFTFVKEENIEYDKIFDAFLSFSHKDDEFVTKEIISIIENKDSRIRLCIHYRHFRPGVFIYNNILNAVQNSKRTVLILSRNFLESEWCLMEFRAAHIQALEDKLHRIILIKVGDFPKEIDPRIKVYLDSTTHLNWGERYFWNKFLYVLPTSTNNRNPVPR